MTRGLSKAPFCALVDWGTSSFRLWLVSDDGAILGERRSAEGMLAAGAGAGFAAVLETHLAALEAPAGLPVVACGMVGARQGWIEAPYAQVPAGLDAIIAGAMRVPGIARDVRILPGVAQMAQERPDVMRGEETIIVGLAMTAGAEDASSLICLPGTHSKWTKVQGGTIAAFSSYMTGEVFALLSGQSILRHAVEAGADPLASRHDFDAGVSESLAEPASVLNRLFALRAAGLFGRNTPARAGAKLSGLLIGQELAGVAVLWPQDRAVTLAASGRMLDLYRRALGLAGFAVREADADAAVRRALMAAARHCFSS